MIGIYLGVYLEKKSKTKIDELTVCAVDTRSVSSCNKPPMTLAIDRAWSNARIRAEASKFIAGYAEQLRKSGYADLQAIKHKTLSHSHPDSGSYAGGVRIANIQQADPITEEVRNAATQIAEELGIAADAVHPLKGDVLSQGEAFLDGLGIAFDNAAEKRALLHAFGITSGAHEGQIETLERRRSRFVAKQLKSAKKAS